ncbi:unnamed protein product [Medioppia subpectinata]|uniref:Cytochrome P450 n=1 Tax=Medioppia subpectinata TaxID=1979941 RepID=A0A7R9L462_9ACAR|nr:unnamed protein product [Medioppia subpectinata]CAG2115238.1 unnamed protein product [Medioppia subpectinata]
MKLSIEVSFENVLRNFQKHWNVKTSELSKVYGPVFTLWIGPLPFVFICDPDMGRQAFNKSHFCGRPETQYQSLYNDDKNARGVPSADYGPAWNSGRRIMNVLKTNYAKSNDFSQLVANSTAEMLRLIKVEEASTETTLTAYKWMLLYLAYYQKLQQNIRDEIMNVLGKYNIPVDSVLMLHQAHIMNNPEHWTNPDCFNPDRFLDENGCLDLVKPNAYMPFASGKRICPGEPMALNELFYSMVTLLQLTKDYTINLHCETERTLTMLESDPVLFEILIKGFTSTLFSTLFYTLLINLNKQIPITFGYMLEMWQTFATFNHRWYSAITGVSAAGIDRHLIQTYILFGRHFSCYMFAANVRVQYLENKIHCCLKY